MDVTSHVKVILFRFWGLKHDVVITRRQGRDGYSYDESGSCMGQIRAQTKVWTTYRGPVEIESGWLWTTHPWPSFVDHKFLCSMIYLQIWLAVPPSSELLRGFRSRCRACESYLLTGVKSSENIYQWKLMPVWIGGFVWILPPSDFRFDFRRPKRYCR